MKPFGYLCLFFISVFALWFLLFSPAAPTKEEDAYRLFASHDYEKAKAYLSAHSEAFTKSHYQLYTGYIERGLGDIEASNHSFELAAKEANPESEKEIIYEAYLNQAYNGYLQQNLDAMAKALGEAEKLGIRNQDWIKLFTALEERLRLKQPRSLKAWQKEEKRLPLSNWMQKGLGENFNDFWFFIEEARNDLYIGNVTQARQKLREKASHAPEGQLNEINLLEGLTYLNEAAEKPSSAATPYYKLAYSYFRQVPMMEPRFTVYRDQILSAVNRQIDALLEAKQYQDMTFYAGTLEKWQSADALKKLNGELLKTLESNIAENNESNIQYILSALDLSLTDKQEREEIAAKFNDRMLEELKNGNTVQALGDWEAVRKFSLTTPQRGHNLADITASMALELVPTDNPDLMGIMPYMDLWQTIVKDPKERYALSLALLQLAEDPYLLEAHPKKALSLMQIAARLTPVDMRAAFQEKLNIAIGKINGSTVDRLKEVVAAYEAGEYAKAETVVQPLLEIDPRNQEILRYAGLIAYKQDDFSKSLEFLTGSGAEDAETKLALAVSESIAGNAAKGNEMLAGLTTDQNKKRLYTKLGLGLIAAGRVDQGIERLAAISDPGQEELAALAYAYAQKGKWQESLKGYESLDATMKRIPGIQAVYVSDLIGMGELDKAEQSLHEENKPSETSREPTPSFHAFAKKTLDTLSLDYLSASFYKDKRHDLEKALGYVNKIPYPTARELVLKGEILYSMKKYAEAQDVFFKAIAEDKSESKATAAEAYPFLAQIALEQDRPADAFVALQAYKQNKPDSNRYRIEMARAAIGIRRYDIALVELDKLLSERKLDHDEELLRIQTLVQLDRDKEAREIGNALAGNKELTSLQKIELAEWLLTARDIKLAATLSKDAEANKQLMPVEKAKMLSLMTEAANFSSAVAFTKEYNDELNSTGEGLFAQALLSEALNQETQSLLFAKKALQASPNDQEILKFLEEREPNPKALAEQIASLKNVIVSGMLSAQLAYVESLIEFTVQSQKMDPAKPLTDYNELHQAEEHAAKLAKNYPFLPEAFSLQGKAAYLLNNQQVALEAFQKELKIDPSSVDAYKYLSKIFAEHKNNDEAIQQLIKALLFAPGDPTLWRPLAELYLKSNNIVSAEASWEAAIRYRPNDLNSILALAQLKLELRNPEAALKLVERALKASPSSPEALRLQLVALYNPLLKATKLKPSDIALQQESAYEAYHKVAPKEAEALRDQMKE